MIEVPCWLPWLLLAVMIGVRVWGAVRAAWRDLSGYDPF